ncbi:MAG: hypothetical protein ABIW84_11065 [Ilumatobacteraceae bacterium]
MSTANKRTVMIVAALVTIGLVVTTIALRRGGHAPEVVVAAEAGAPPATSNDAGPGGTSPPTDQVGPADADTVTTPSVPGPRDAPTAEGDPVADEGVINHPDWAVPMPETMEGLCVDATSDGPQWDDRWSGLWQSQPLPNQPVVMQVCLDDANPAIGQQVNATIVATDPDAVVKARPCALCVYQWGDEPFSGNLCRDMIWQSVEPEPTPVPEPGNATFTETHAYASAGDHVLCAEAWSGPGTGSPHPYVSGAKVCFSVIVHELAWITP